MAACLPKSASHPSPPRPSITPGRECAKVTEVERDRQGRRAILATLPARMRAPVMVKVIHQFIPVASARSASQHSMGTVRLSEPIWSAREMEMRSGRQSSIPPSCHTLSADAARRACQAISIRARSTTASSGRGASTPPAPAWSLPSCTASRDQDAGEGYLALHQFAHGGEVYLRPAILDTMNFHRSRRSRPFASAWPPRLCAVLLGRRQGQAAFCLPYSKLS